MRTIARVTALATLASVITVVACGDAAAASPPDFTGVWANLPVPGAGGRPEPPKLPALTPHAKARVDALQKLVTPGGETPGQYCLGAGMPASAMAAGAGYPMEIIQRPEQITIIYELHGETRRVYFGERNAPQPDRVPARNGYSSGRWEGDTLVVETDNLLDQVESRYPHSDQARIVERYALDGEDAQGRRILKVEMTMTDPKFYAEPVRVTKRWVQVPNGRILPYDCNEEFWLERLEQLSSEAGVPLP